MNKEIKITGQTPERLNANIESILNIACVVAGAGRIPTEFDVIRGSGRYWERDADNSRYHLYPTANDYWAFIREEGEKHIVLEFRYRYDRTGICQSLTDLILARFSDCATEYTTIKA